MKYLRIRKFFSSADIAKIEQVGCRVLQMWPAKWHRRKVGGGKRKREREPHLGLWDRQTTTQQKVQGPARLESEHGLHPKISHKNVFSTRDPAMASKDQNCHLLLASLPPA